MLISLLTLINARSFSWNHGEYSIVGLFFPALVSLITLIVLPREVFTRARQIWSVLVLSSIINGLYFYYQNITGWDSGNGAYWFPVLYVMLFMSIPSFEGSAVIKFLAPFLKPQPDTKISVAFTLMWLSIIPFDVGSAFFMPAYDGSSGPNFSGIGGFGFNDGLFIMPVGMVFFIFAYRVVTHFQLKRRAV